MFAVKRYTEEAGVGADEEKLKHKEARSKRKKAKRGEKNVAKTSVENLVRKAKNRYQAEEGNVENFDETENRNHEQEKEKALLSDLAPSLFQTFKQLQPDKSSSKILNKKPKDKRKRRKRARAEALANNNEDFLSESKNTTTLREDSKQWNLNGKILQNLENECGITSFFGVQKRSIHRILTSDVDVCIAAPTGSGKTLAFVVPIVQQLISRVVRRLRALILLPTRDLAKQVKRVFDMCCVNTGLVVGFSSGQSSFEAEQRLLMCPASGASKVDILVATPGRIIEHIKNTKHFTLEHLQFLVVDEADRLLSQSYQNWLSRIHEAAYRETGSCVTWANNRVHLNPATVRRRYGSSLNSHRNDEPILRRILCSATLSDNPQTMAALGLSKPIYIMWNSAKNTVAEDDEFRFSLPSTLKNFMVTCTHANKPLALIHLLQGFKNAKTLIFTRSVEATHRLFLLLKLFGDLGVGVGELSSNQNPRERADVIEKISNGDLSILVSSDIMARGIDVAGLENVVNYDIPPYVKTLVHRAGRTARAGKSGSCYGLVRTDQARHYRQLLSELELKPTLIKTDNDKLDAYRERYSKAMEEMKETVEN